jgi:hypothetical protein
MLLVLLDGCIFDSSGLQHVPGGDVVVPDIVVGDQARPERDDGRPDRARDVLSIDSACGQLGQPCCGATCTGADLICSSNQCVRCGSQGDPCCASDTCVAGQVCLSAKCTACGAIGRPCCKSGDCNAGGVCENATCVTCGQVNTRCCASKSCTFPLLCDGTDCKACGLPTQPCCVGLCITATCNGNNVCISSSCGGNGQLCCYFDLTLKGYCNPGLACNGILCSCGYVGEPCCPSGKQCELGLICDSSTKKCKK